MSDTKLIYDEVESEERMKNIGQNGNTGEHYTNIDTVLSDTFTKEPTWTQTITKADQRSMSQAVSSSTAIASDISFRGELKEEQQLPDAKKHQIISFIKSAVRIVGYAFIPYDLAIATILLIFSEFVGIIEELV